MMRLLTNKDVYCYRTAMHWAALHGRTKTVEAILHYFNPDQLLHVFSLCDIDGQTALQLAGNNDHHQHQLFHKRAMQHVSKEMKSRILLFTFAWQFSRLLSTLESWLIRCQSKFWKFSLILSDQYPIERSVRCNLDPTPTSFQFNLKIEYQCKFEIILGCW